MKKMINFRLAAWLLCLATISSCATNSIDKSDVYDDADPNKEGITFIASAMERVADFSTKGTLIEQVSQIEEVGVYCYFTSSLLYLENIAADHDGFRSTYYWPQYDQGAGAECEMLNFYGYAPHEGYSDKDGISVVEDATDFQQLTIQYIVPTVIEDQPDLLIAKPVVDALPAEDDADDDFQFEMEHALAAICFRVQNDQDFPDPNKRVYSVEIEQVVGEGKVKRSMLTDEPLEWYDTEVLNDFTFYADISIVPNSVSQSITAKDGYLMMIPQTFEEDVTVVVTLCHPLGGCKEKRYTSIPAGTEWKEGFIYEYTLLDGSFIEHEGRDNGQANCYMLHPYTSYAREYYIPIDERINEFWYEYASQPDEDSGDDNTWYYLGDKVGVETAVVWYDCNSIAGFECEVIDSEYDADEFIRNVGKVTPACEPNYITEDAQVAMKVTLPAGFNEGNVVVAVWRDMNGDGERNTEIERDADGKVIATNETLWSWHFWVTGYNPDTVISTESDYVKVVGYGEIHRYRDDETAFMDDIEAIWENGGVYQDKYIMDRHLGARASTYEGMGGNTYGQGFVMYQFGRKDPFPGNFATYDNDYQYMAPKSGKQSYATAVHNPNSFYGGVTNWCTETEVGAYSMKLLWNDVKVKNDHVPEWDHNGNRIANYDHLESTDIYEKSIFDPSPLGWKVPIAGVWSDLFVDNGTLDGVFDPYVVSSSGDYVSSSGTNYRLYALTNAIYPIGGYIEHNGGVPTTAGTYGFCRTASPSIQNIDYDQYPDNGNNESGTELEITDFAYMMCLSSFSALINYSYLRSHGMPVRPVQE
ncbi:MAG: fimbrillin family protein [Rikenellaceae bacterium]